MISLRDLPYLIIGGTTKGATTSVFFYLAAHPEVCPASGKETRFFLDLDYPLSSQYRFDRDGLHKYSAFYGNCVDPEYLRVEATPDYLYSRGAARRIRNSLPQARMLFLLREPISRLMSWYGFARQKGRLTKGVTFHNYVERQLAYRDYRRVPQHMRALEQGRYVRYLRPYFEVFGADNICVVFFEDLLADPVHALEEVCLFSGIDPRFFDGFEFRVHNATRAIRSARLDRLHERVRAVARTLARNQPMLQAVKDTLWRSVEPLYLHLNVVDKPSRVDISTIRQTLQDYYGDDITALEQLLGKPIPPRWYSALMKSKDIEEDLKATT